VTDKPDSVVLQ